MKKLIMKCADERRRAFAMITSVWEDDGKRFVEKCAVHKEGRRHLENMMRYRTLLDEIYPGVRVCPAKLTEDGLVFDFIEGSSLEDRYRLAASESDRYALVLYMKSHAELLDSVPGGTVPFEETDGANASASARSGPPEDLPGADEPLKQESVWYIRSFESEGLEA